MVTNGIANPHWSDQIHNIYPRLCPKQPRQITVTCPSSLTMVTHQGQTVTHQATLKGWKSGFVGDHLNVFIYLVPFAGLQGQTTPTAWWGQNSLNQFKSPPPCFSGIFIKCFWIHLCLGMIQLQLATCSTGHTPCYQSCIWQHRQTCKMHICQTCNRAMIKK